jgi:hypothetical protein
MPAVAPPEDAPERHQIKPHEEDALRRADEFQGVPPPRLLKLVRTSERILLMWFDLVSLRGVLWWCFSFRFSLRRHEQSVF